MGDTIGGSGQIIIKLNVDATTGKTTIEGMTKSLGGMENQIKKVHKSSNLFFTHFQKSLIVLNQAAELFRKIAQLSQTIIKPLEESALFEGFKVTLKNFIGDVDEADKRFKEMVAFAARTPFTVPGIVEAGNQLQALGRYSLDTITNLGDLAAASGKDVSQALQAYTNLVVGRTGIAIKQFRTMLITSQDWTREIGKEVLQTGKGVKASITEMVEAFPKILAKKNFTGLMAEQVKTLNGVLSNLKDNLQQVLAFFGDTFLEQAKTFLNDIIKMLDWLKTNTSALRATFETLLMWIKWALGAALFGGLNKIILTFIGSVGKLITAFTTVTTAASKFGAAMKMISVSGIGKIIALVGILATAYTFLSETQHKSVADLERLNEQYLSEKELRARELKGTIAYNDGLVEVINTYKKMLDSTGSNVRKSKEFKNVTTELVNELPHLATGAKGLTTNLDILGKEADALAYASSNAKTEVSNLGIEIEDLVDRINKLKIEKTFEDFIEDISDVPSWIGKQLKPIVSIGEWLIDALTPGAVTDSNVKSKVSQWVKANVTDVISGATTAEDLEAIKAKFRKMLSKDITTIVREISEESVNKARILYKSQTANLSREDYAKVSSDELKDASEKGVKELRDVWLNLKHKYEEQETFIQNTKELGGAFIQKGSEAMKDFENRINTAIDFQSKKIADGILKVNKTLTSDLEQSMQVVSDSFSKNIVADKSALLKYKKYLEENLRAVQDLDLETLRYDKENQKRVFDIKNKTGETVKEVAMIYKASNDKATDTAVQDRRRSVLRVLQAEFDRTKDAITAIDKQYEEGAKDSDKKRKDWLEEWKDRAKILEDNLKDENVLIDLTPDFTEEKKNEEKIKAVKKYNEDIISLQKEFRSDLDIVIKGGWKDRNADEATFNTKLNEGIVKNNDEIIQLYTKMYDDIENIINTMPLSAEEAAMEVQRQLDIIGKIIVEKSGKNSINTKFIDLTQDDLSKITPSLLKFFTSLRDGVRKFGAAAHDAFNDKYIIDFINKINSIKADQPLASFVKELNDSKDLVLLMGSKLEDLKNEINSLPAIPEEKFQFNVGANIDDIAEQVNIVNALIEIQNEERMKSIVILEDEGQKQYATGISTIKMYEEKIKLLKAAYAITSNSDDNDYEKTLRANNFSEEADANKKKRLEESILILSGLKQLEGDLADERKTNADDGENIDRNYWQKRLDIASEFVDKMRGIADSLYNMAKASADKEIKLWLDVQQKRLDGEHKNSLKYARTKTQEVRIDEIYAQEQEDLQKEADKKKYERLKGWFELKKALSVVEIGISTAAAVMKNNEIAGIVLGSALNIVTIAMGAAQVAAVLAQQMPEANFAEGGWTGTGNKYDKKGVVHAEEFVVKRGAAERNRPILEEMNKGAAFGRMGSDSKALMGELAQNNIAKNIAGKLVGQNSIVDIKRDFTSSRNAYDIKNNNKDLINEISGLKDLMNDYLKNPVPPKLVVSKRDAEKITSAGVGRIKRNRT